MDPGLHENTVERSRAEAFHEGRLQYVSQGICLIFHRSGRDWRCALSMQPHSHLWPLGPSASVVSDVSVERSTVSVLVGGR